MSEPYYQMEDMPDMDDPDTAMELFDQQREGLTAKIEAAAVDVHTAGETLAAIKQWALEQGVPNLPEAAGDIWARIQSVQGLIAAYDSTLNGGVAAMQTIKDHRDSVIAELEDLLDAIAMGNEAHPQLERYAEAIREDEMEYQQDAAEEYAMEGAMDWALQNIHHDLDVELGRMGYNDIRGYDLLDAIQEPSEMTDPQREAYKAFLETLRPVANEGAA